MFILRFCLPQIVRDNDSLKRNRRNGRLLSVDEYKNSKNSNKISAERLESDRKSFYENSFSSAENRFEEDQMQQLLQQHVFSPAQLQQLLKNHSFHMQQQNNKNPFENSSLNHFKKFDFTRSQFDRSMQNLHEQLQMNLLQQTQLLQHKQSQKNFLGMYSYNCSNFSHIHETPFLKWQINDQVDFSHQC